MGKKVSDWPTGNIIRETVSLRPRELLPTIDLTVRAEIFWVRKRTQDQYSVKV